MASEHGMESDSLFTIQSTGIQSTGALLVCAYMAGCLCMCVCISITFQMFTHTHTHRQEQQCTVSFVRSTVECVKHGYLLTHTVFARILNILSVFIKFRFFCFSVFVVNFVICFASFE